MWIIGIALAAGAAVVAVLIRYSEIAGKVLDGVAAAAFFVFALVAADVVRGTLVHDTVFMTEVHRVLLNPWFLASGMYLGPYALARLTLLSLR
jgi:ABC-type Co2+ transport system permease subunit